MFYDELADLFLDRLGEFPNFIHIRFTPLATASPYGIGSSLKFGSISEEL